MNPKIEELLIDWEIAKEKGQFLTAEELCVDCPEFIEDVRRLLADLESTSWIFDEPLPAKRTPRAPQGIPVVASQLISNLEKLDIVPVEILRDLDAEAMVEPEVFFGQLFDENYLTQYQSEVLSELRQGPLILDRYVILDEIGSGGMGVVYKARHRTMERIVALKVLPFQSELTDSRVERFQREIRTTAKLNHPNVVTSYDAHTIEGQPFLVMEFVDGIDLEQLVQQKGNLPWEQACSFIQQIASGLHRAHRAGIIHRDLKPSNIIVTTEGIAKLLDLGLARAQLESLSGSELGKKLTNESIPMGTLDYMSPEQARDAASADERSDVYSLGCTLYHLLVGEPPYRRNNPVETVIAHRESKIPAIADGYEVPEFVSNTVYRMMQKDPDRRFSSMREVVEALDYSDSHSSANSINLRPKTDSTPSVAASNPTRPKAWLPIACLGILIAAGLGVAIWNAVFSKPSLSTNPKDIAKWCLANDGAITIRSTLGEQLLIDVHSIPEGEFDIVGIELPTVTSETSLTTLASLPHLETLSFAEDFRGSFDIEQLKELKQLKHLSLYDSYLKPEEAKTIGSLPPLESLGLDAVSIEGQLEQILTNHVSSLKSLSLEMTDVSEAELIRLNRVKNLERLDISETSFMSKEVLKSFQSLENLSYLDLSSTNFQDSFSEHLVMFPSLEVLIADDVNIGDESLKYISRIANLFTLSLESTNLSDAGLETIATIAQLDTLYISDNQVTKFGLGHLEKLSELTFLAIGGASTDDSHIPAISRLEFVLSLDVSNSGISGKGLQQLDSLALQSIDLSGCEFLTVPDIQRFRNANPDCDIVLDELTIPDPEN